MVDWLKRHVRSALIIVGLAFAFSVFGVYGTDEIPFLYRFPMWVFSLGIGAAAAIFIVPQIFEREPMSRWTPWLQIPLTAALISVAVFVVSAGIEMIDGTPMPLRIWPLQYFYIFVISLIITIGAYLLNRADDAAELSASLSERDPVEVFLERLPVKYRSAELFAVSSEDHYLRIHTSLGEELILMRLADALRELGDTQGLQVHRSWWVARDGIADTDRENGRPVLILKSGGRAPVSRTYQKSAREAGLL